MTQDDIEALKNLGARQRLGEAIRQYSISIEENSHQLANFDLNWGEYTAKTNIKNIKDKLECIEAVYNELTK